MKILPVWSIDSIITPGIQDILTIAVECEVQLKVKIIIIIIMIIIIIEIIIIMIIIIIIIILIIMIKATMIITLPRSSSPWCMTTPLPRIELRPLREINLSSC